MTYCNLKKDKPKPNKKHLTFIRSLPCCKCGSRLNVTAHHILRTKEHLHGLGKKCPDTKAVPMCNICHTELHDVIGDEEKYFKYENLEALADELFKNSEDDMMCLTLLTFFTIIQLGG